MNFGSSISVTNLYSIRKNFEKFLLNTALAHEVIHEVWTTCTLFVQPFTFMMTNSSHESLHFPVRILLN